MGIRLDYRPWSAPDRSGVAETVAFHLRLGKSSAQANTVPKSGGVSPLVQKRAQYFLGP
jgi:hypothetical protein